VTSADHEYVVEYYDNLGKRRHRWRRDPTWFPAVDTIRWATPREPPRPLIMGIDQTSDGLLWVVLAIADREWPRGLGPPQQGEGGQVYYPIADWERAYDALIEVVDPRVPALVASARLDVFIVGAVGGRFLAAAKEEASGQPYIVLYRRRLSRR
jgi:hypothetical protein